MPEITLLHLLYAFQFVAFVIFWGALCMTWFQFRLEFTTLRPTVWGKYFALAAFSGAVVVAIFFKLKESL